MRDIPDLPALSDPEAVQTAAHWRGLAPALTLSPEVSFDDGLHHRLSTAVLDGAQDDMCADGVFALPRLWDDGPARALRTGIDQLRGQGVHEVFALLYDEPWRLLGQLRPLLRRLLGPGCRAVPLPFVNVVPGGDAGFGPHRDRWTDPVDDQGLPKMLTTWVSLTDVPAERACLSVLPASADPHFPDELATLAIGDLRDIRALPVPAGSLVCFNQAIVHWGGKNFTPDTRMSFAFELERDGIEGAREPAIVLDEGRVTFAQRAAFLAAVVPGLYRNQTPIPLLDVARARALCPPATAAAA